MELAQQLPTIDIQAGAKLFGGDKKILHEILALFMQQLPQQLVLINQAYTTNQYSELLQHIHKLHGAAAYCGIPKFKFILHEIEVHLHEQESQALISLMPIMDAEVQALTQAYYAMTA